MKIISIRKERCIMFKIIHTNDIHSHLENWSGIERFVHERRHLYKEQGLESLLLDVGDAIDSHHPVIEATKGQKMIELFNGLSYDCVTIGNNEGINITPEVLNELYDEAEYDVVIANVLDGNLHNIPNFANEYKIYEVDNQRILILGLTAPYYTYNYNGYHVLNPMDVLRNLLNKIEQESPDFIILLSHLGLSEDRYIAQTFPQINLILGAHTHHLLTEGEWVNDTLLTGCGRYGQYIGEVTVEFSEGEFILKAETFSIEATKDFFIDEGEALLQEMKYPMFRYDLLADDLTSKKSFIQFALSAVQNFADADVTVLNSGLFLDNLTALETNHSELQKALPHPMHIAKATFSGEQLIEVLNQFVEKGPDLISRPIKGLGFRGKIFGELVLKNAIHDNQNNKWKVSGKYIQLEKKYTLATVDHLVFLPFFNQLQDAETELLFPELLRNVVGRQLQQIGRTGDND